MAKETFIESIEVNHYFMKDGRNEINMCTPGGTFKVENDKGEILTGKIDSIIPVGVQVLFDADSGNLDRYCLDINSFLSACVEARGKVKSNPPNEAGKEAK